MAWTAPRTWAVGELVTASVMNTHVRDNLKYLKGASGDIGLDDDLIVGSSDVVGLGAAVGRILRVDGNGLGIPSSALSLQGNQTADGDVGLVLAHNAALGAGDRRIFQWAISRDGADNSGKMRFILWNAGTPRTALVIKPDGKVGIGIDPPTGQLQVAGASGGGLLVYPYSGLGASTTTILPAGSVTAGFALSYVTLPSSGSVNGSTVFLSTPGGSANLYTDGGSNAFTINYVVGGSVTLTRTAGTRTYSGTVTLTYF